MEFDVKALAKRVLESGGDIDHELMSVCMKMYPENYRTIHGAITAVVDELSKRHNIDRRNAFKIMAYGDFKVKKVGSREELPEDIRKELEQGKTIRVERKKVTKTFYTSEGEKITEVVEDSQQEVPNYRCNNCSYKSAAKFEVCPRCGEEKKSIFKKLFGWFTG